VRHETDAESLLEELRGDGAEGDTRRGLPGGGALEHRTSVVEGVLAHAHEVGVARTRTGERRVARTVQQRRVDRVGGHDVDPLGPLRVADLDRERTTLGDAVPQTGEDAHLVLLELHPGAAAVAQTTARERVLDVGGQHLHTCGDTLDDAHECRAVRFT